ncbi:delta24(24(1))-sterol reductase [Rhizoctonia solani]|uniref:Delta24(24(1))-sterol reductase n=1 Tax=Rhizoctonia solani TaxID=456999 RepID=A0A0K6FX32_9AGAM|nr:delta24(24(1))-sterol reductase [Rhizoctonia solani]
MSHSSSSNERTPLKHDTSREPTVEGRASDARLDAHEHYEFGGPSGVAAMMVFFPLMMYYFWICLRFYNGSLVHPESFRDIGPFLGRMWTHICQDAAPTLRAWAIYTGLMSFELALAFIMPGYKQEGLPVPSLGYKSLNYYCNALWSFYGTLIAGAVLHTTGLFRLTQIIDHFGEIMTVAMIYGLLISLVVYVVTIALGKQMRMSGNFFYDFWMGACLNPRLGIVDLKMWAEVRIPWVLLFCIAISGACKQYDTYGYVTPNMAFMVLATGLYINACAKGEECIPQTWDMFHEKWGFMVIFWNFAGVPFTYCYPVLYLASQEPETYRFPTAIYILLFATLLTVYYIFDTSMSQKSRFKMQMQGTYTPRWAFPQLPYGTIENPTFIQTAHGNKLLTSGWWAYARKPGAVGAELRSHLPAQLWLGACSIAPLFKELTTNCMLPVQSPAMTYPPSPTITPAQAHALFSFLTHTQTLAEMQSLKVPGRVSNSGPPFNPKLGPDVGDTLPLPILNFLLRRLALTLPGFKDVPQAVWSEHAQQVLEALAAQDLSDSYDKGSISKRKILGFAVVIVAEYAIRGALGGVPGRDSPRAKLPEKWDPNNPAHVLRAWDEVIHGFAYGTQMDELVEWVTKTDDLTKLPPMLQTAHQFATMTCASFLHYLLVVNPAGPTLVTLIKRVHGLLPYGILRQTLRVSNAATLLSAVLRIFLQHAPSVRGWFNGKRGQNLLQTIMSSILGGDETRIMQSIRELDSSPDAGTKDQIAAIENYVQNGTREGKLDIRDKSATKSQSIVVTILSEANVPIPTSETVHTNLLNRLSLSLAARDRQRLISVLCENSPSTDDHLAALIRAVGNAFDPILRGVHRATDFAGAISDIQAFLDDLLALAQDKASGPAAYFELCKDHQKNIHKFLHALAKNAPELKEAYLTWYKECMKVYARPEGAYVPPASESGSGEAESAGALTPELARLVESLSDQDRATVIAEAEEYAAWLGALSSKSDERTDQLLSPDGPWPQVAPGVYLAMWEDMIASTGVTPAEANGPVRYGTTASVQNASRKDDGEHGEVAAPRLYVGTGNPAPKMPITRKVLSGPFEELLIKNCMN